MSTGYQTAPAMGQQWGMVLDDPDHLTIVGNDKIFKLESPDCWQSANYLPQLWPPIVLPILPRQHDIVTRSGG